MFPNSSRILARHLLQCGRRGVATRVGGGGGKLRGAVGVLGVGAGLGLGFTAWEWLNKNSSSALTNPMPLYAASAPSPQHSVVSQTKNHALYLWITLSNGADAKKCARVVARLEKLVDEVSPPDLRDEEDEVLAGVGFGPKFLSKLGKKSPETYDYPDRKGALGDLPSTGGDIFIHAKSNTISKLFELAQAIERDLPAGSVEKFQDIYGFVYRNGRDLSGFIDGTENPADEDSRIQVALNKTSGSYCITQKWIHDHPTIKKQKSPDLGTKKPLEIVRQSQPYGTVGGESGLFFIGYAASPHNFEYMLDRMTGTNTATDKHCDDIMRLSKCVQGTYWYFPPLAELRSY